MEHILHISLLHQENKYRSLRIIISCFRIILNSILIAFYNIIDLPLILVVPSCEVINNIKNNICKINTAL